MPMKGLFMASDNQYNNCAFCSSDCNCSSCDCGDIDNCASCECCETDCTTDAEDCLCDWVKIVRYYWVTLSSYLHTILILTGTSVRTDLIFNKKNNRMLFSNYPENKIENWDIAKATTRIRFISLSKL